MSACCICLEDMDDDASKHTIDDCGHAFHASCLITWMRKGSMSCPACRHDLNATRMDGMTIHARARHLRARSRNARAPKELKRLVERVRLAEEKQQERTIELRAFRRAHRDVFQQTRAMQIRKWSADRLLRERLRLLGTYHSDEFPLPPLIVYD